MVPELEGGRRKEGEERDGASEVMTIERADFSFLSFLPGCRGIYDEEFMDYTVEVLKKCKEYGFKVSFPPARESSHSAKNREVES